MFTPRCEHSTVKKNGAVNRISLPGDKFTPGWTTSPLGSKFAPRGEVKNGPQTPTYVPGFRIARKSGKPIEFSIALNSLSEGLNESPILLISTAEYNL
jgi:hypothetical protein